jgi:hypothetical protein
LCERKTVSRKGAKAQSRSKKQAALNSLAFFLCATSAFAGDSSVTHERQAFGKFSREVLIPTPV